MATRLRIVPKGAPEMEGWTTVRWGEGFVIPKDVTELVLDDVVSRCPVGHLDTLFGELLGRLADGTTVTVVDLDRTAAAMRVASAKTADATLFDGREHVYVLREAEGVLSKHPLRLVRKRYADERFLITAVVEREGGAAGTAPPS